MLPRCARSFTKTAAPIESNNPQMTRMDANNRLSVSPSQLVAVLECALPSMAVPISA